MSEQIIVSRCGLGVHQYIEIDLGEGVATAAWPISATEKDIEFSRPNAVLVRASGLTKEQRKVWLPIITKKGILDPFNYSMAPLTEDEQKQASLLPNLQGKFQWVAKLVGRNHLYGSLAREFAKPLQNYSEPEMHRETKYFILDDGYYEARLAAGSRCGSAVWYQVKDGEVNPVDYSEIKTAFPESTPEQRTLAYKAQYYPSSQRFTG